MPPRAQLFFLFTIAFAHTLCWGHGMRINYIVVPQYWVPQFEKIDTRSKTREMTILVFFPKWLNLLAQIGFCVHICQMQ